MKEITDRTNLINFTEELSVVVSPPKKNDNGNGAVSNEEALLHNMLDECESLSNQKLKLYGAPEFADNALQNLLNSAGYDYKKNQKNEAEKLIPKISKIIVEKVEPTPISVNLGEKIASAYVTNIPEIKTEKEKSPLIISSEVSISKPNVYTLEESIKIDAPLTQKIPVPETESLKDLTPETETISEPIIWNSVATNKANNSLYSKLCSLTINGISYVEGAVKNINLGPKTITKGALAMTLLYFSLTPSDFSETNQNNFFESNLTNVFQINYESVNQLTLDINYVKAESSLKVNSGDNSLNLISKYYGLPESEISEMHEAQRIFNKKYNPDPLMRKQADSDYLKVENGAVVRGRDGIKWDLLVPGQEIKIYKQETETKKIEYIYSQGRYTDPETKISYGSLPEFIESELKSSPERILDSYKIIKDDYLKEDMKSTSLMISNFETESNYYNPVSKPEISNLNKFNIFKESFFSSPNLQVSRLPKYDYLFYEGNFVSKAPEVNFVNASLRL